MTYTVCALVAEPCVNCHVNDNPLHMYTSIPFTMQLCNQLAVLAGLCCECLIHVYLQLLINWPPQQERLTSLRFRIQHHYDSEFSDAKFVMYYRFLGCESSLQHHLLQQTCTHTTQCKLAVCAWSLQVVRATVKEPERFFSCIQ